MNRYNYILSILILSQIFIGCNSDDVSQTANENFKLTKIDFFDSDNNLIGATNFEYDEELRLTSLENDSDNISFTYIYENNNIISIISNGGAVINYVYDGDLIVSSSRTINGVLSPNTFEYEYDSMNRLINAKIYVNGILNCEINDTLNIQNNIETSISLCGDNEPTQNSFEYDDMKNPSSLYFNSGLLKVLRIGNNNIINSYDTSMNLVSSSTYEYNSEGYPTVSITTNTIFNTNFGPSVFKNEYTYENIAQN